MTERLFCVVILPMPDNLLIYDAASLNYSFCLDLVSLDDGSGFLQLLYCAANLYSPLSLGRYAIELLAGLIF